MLKRFLAPLLLAVWPSMALAQICGTVDLTETFNPAETAELEALVAPHVYGEGLLWRAEAEGSTVTIAGTLHIPDSRFDPLIAKLRPAIETADMMILEATAEDEAALAALAADRPEMFFLTEGKSLIDLLGPEEWALAAAEMEARGIPPFVAAQFKPWYASLVLAVPPCALTVMQAGEKGLDRRLEALAKEFGVETGGLETAEVVLEAFAGETIERQLEGLRITLTTNNDDAATTSTLVELYFRGRTRATWEVSRILIDRAGIKNGRALFQEVEDTLLDGRNNAWAPLILELAEGRDIVLAVGAAHLSGETGVLRVLERAGYRISPL